MNKSEEQGFVSEFGGLAELEHPQRQEPKSLHPATFAETFYPPLAPSRPGIWGTFELAPFSRYVSRVLTYARLTAESLPSGQRALARAVCRLLAVGWTCIRWTCLAIYFLLAAALVISAYALFSLCFG